MKQTSSVYDCGEMRNIMLRIFLLFRNVGFKINLILKSFGISNFSSYLYLLLRGKLLELNLKSRGAKWFSILVRLY